MGELSGHLLPILFLVPMLTGCLDDTVEPEQPSIDDSDEVLMFAGQQCDATSAEALVAPAAVQDRLPEGFTPTGSAVPGLATVALTMVNCKDGRVGNLTVALESVLNFWFIEVYVTPPEWAQGDTAHAFVLGFYSSDDLIASRFPIFNLAFEPGLGAPTAEGGHAESADGAVTFVAEPTDQAAMGRDVRHFLEQENGTIAAWDSWESIRQPIQSGGAVLHRVTADPGTIWGQVVGPSGFAPGFTSDNYRFGPGAIYWIGPPA